MHDIVLVDAGLERLPLQLLGVVAEHFETRRRNKAADAIKISENDHVAGALGEQPVLPLRAAVTGCDDAPFRQQHRSRKSDQYDQSEEELEKQDSMVVAVQLRRRHALECARPVQQPEYGDVADQPDGRHCAGKTAVEDDQCERREEEKLQRQLRL
jgi:hypothetical protein